MGLPFLVWSILSFIWGSTWLFIKTGLDELPPFTFAGVRFTVALVPLILIIALTRRPIPRRASDWRLIAWTGFLIFTVNYGLIFWGENFISSGLTAVLFSTLPLFGMLWAHWRIPTEPITANKIAGVVLAIVGVGIIFSSQIELTGVTALWGCTAVVGASLVASYSDVVIKLHARHIDPVVLSAGQMIVGTVPLLAVGRLLEGDFSSHAWGATAWTSVVYLAFVGTSLGFVLFYWLIQHMEVTKVVLIPLSSTVVAVLVGMAVLGERMSLQTIAGAACVLLGLAVSSFRRS